MICVRFAAGVGIALTFAACSGGDSTSSGNGSLQVTVSGVPSGPAAVSVTGPGGYHSAVTQTTTLSRLAAGDYKVIATSVVADSETYAPAVDTATVNVAEGGSPAHVSVDYALASGRLTVAITGLPNGVSPLVFVSPVSGTTDTITTSKTINNLKPGKWYFSAGTVAQGSTTYATSFLYDSVVIVASPTPANISIVYAAATASLSIVVDTIAGALAPNLLVTGPFGYSHAITTLGSTVLTALPLGTYSVSGSNVRSATDEYHPYNLVSDVAAFTGSFRSASFEVQHFVSSVSLQVHFGGLPAGAHVSVTVTGPNSFSQTFTSSATVHFLSPGQYVSSPLDSVIAGGIVYLPAIYQWNQPCDAGLAPCVMDLEYAQLDLNIRGMYATQPTQRWDGSVPLIAGRDALVRVFAAANVYGFGRRFAHVRIRWYHSGALMRTDTVLAPTSSFDSIGQQQTFGATANVVLPGALVQPGLSVLADVDPENAVPESNESNNIFPANGTPQPVTVLAADSAHITLVPVMIPLPSGGTGVVGDATQFLSFATKIHPVPGFVVSIHPTYTTTTSAVLQPGDGNGEWVEIITELAALRTADNAPANELYYGVVDPPYTAGVAGLGFIGYPVAMGWDLSIREQILAHEIGHNWGQYHAPCGGPAGVDPNYPYQGASIGIFGWDPGTDSVFDPATAYDLMSYCHPYWTSDYTWDSVYSFRASNGYDVMRAQADVSEPALLVWGREVDGKLTIEPAFEITTRAQMPDGRGPYSLEGLDENGGRVFSYEFTPHQIADGRPGSKSFVFAIPLSQIDATRLGELRVSGFGRTASVKRSGGAMPPSLLKARAMGGGRSALTWDAATYPMAIVRDATTGKVLSFARRGSVTVKARGAGLEVTLSDGVRSVKESLAAQ